MGGAEEGKPHNGRPSNRMLLDADRSNLRRYAGALVDLWKKSSKSDAADFAGWRVLVEQGPDLVRARASLVFLDVSSATGVGSDRKSWRGA